MKNLWKALFCVFILTAIGATAHAGYNYAAQAQFALFKVDEYASDPRLRYNIYCERIDFHRGEKIQTTLVKFDEFEDAFYKIFQDNIEGGELSSDYVQFDTFYKENYQNSGVDFIWLRPFKPGWRVESAKVDFFHGTSKIKEFAYKIGTYKKVPIGTLADPMYKKVMSYDKVYVCSIVE